VWADVTLAEGTGCLECSGTGYHGRTAICELLDLTDHIREMIVDRRPTSEIKRAAREEGMITLRESGLTKIPAGTTAVKEINKGTFVEWRGDIPSGGLQQRTGAPHLGVARGYASPAAGHGGQS